jgi:hypothetical protein
MEKNLKPDEIQALLFEVADRLNTTGHKARVLIVGGVAMGFLDPNRRVTSDVDAVVLPAGIVEPIVVAMAKEFNLPEGWFNDAAKAFIPPVGHEDWIEVARIGDVSINIASTEMLLAMKLYANRTVLDRDDITFLLDACNITSVEQAQEIYERFHAQDVIKDSAVARIEHWLSSRSS